MNSSFPAEIQVMELPVGVWYRLPRRPTGVQRWFGVGAIVFGLSACTFAVFGTFAIAAQGAANAPAGVQGLNQVMIARGIMPLLIGLLACILGLCLTVGHSELEIRDGKLLAIERMGPLRWTWRRRLERIRRFVVYTPPIAPDGQPVTPNTSDRLTLIRVECEGSRTLWLAPGYPREWLRPLADDLASRCTALQSWENRSFVLPAVEVGEEIEDRTQVEFPDRPNQPTRSVCIGDRRLRLSRQIVPGRWQRQLS
jgi:hypothetical protein